MTPNLPSRASGSKYPTTAMTRDDWIATGVALRESLCFWRDLLAVECRRARVRRARQRFPDVTASMTDNDVWWSLGG